MNKARRKLIQDAIDGLEAAKAVLEGIKEDEEEAYENMPESFQQGDKGDAAQEIISKLEQAIESDIESLIGDLRELVDA